jgi:O-antigen ligase
MAFAVPWGSLDTIDLHGLNLNAADLLVGFLALGWLMSWALPTYLKGSGPRDREKGRLPVYLILAMLALIGVMVLSITVAISKKDSLKEIFKWLEFITLVLLGAQYLRTRRDIWTLVVFLLLAAISQALYGYAQAVFSLGPASFVRSFNLRVYGTFNQPNPYAGYLNMALVVALSLTLLGRNWLTRISAGLATCLIGGAFYLTQSRGGQVALIAALIFIILTGVRGIRVWMRVVLIGLLTVVAGMVAGVIPLYLFDQVNRFLGLTGISLTAPNPADYSTAERLAHWIAGLRMYAAHPVLGVGIGNYPDAYAQYYVTIFVNSLGQAHNYYINIAAETGTIGLVIYLLFVLAMLWAGGNAVRSIGRAYWQARQQLPDTREHVQAPPRRDKLQMLLHPARFLQYYRSQSLLEAFGQLTNDRALAIGLMASLITVCVHNLVDDLYDHSMTNVLALLLIALIRLGTITTYEPVESRQGSHASTVGVGPQSVNEHTRVAAQVYTPR